MPEKAESALAIFPPAPVAQVVDRWRRLYDPYVDNMEPHITLVYPLKLSVAEWFTRRDAFAACLESFTPFRIQIHRLNRFLSPAMVLWLEPEDGGMITRMYKLLEDSFPAFIDPPQPPFSFVPHMTVGFFSSLAGLEKAQQEISAELPGLELAFQVNEVAVGASLAGQGKLEKIDIIRLGDR